MCRPENQKEGKRKREEIKWEPGSTQKGKKSRSDREASREREHKHRHKEKYVSVSRLCSYSACKAALHVQPLSRRNVIRGSE